MSTHLPTAFIDVDRICHNFIQLEQYTNPQGVMSNNVSCGYTGKGGMAIHWPSRLAVVKSDAYGHGQIEVAYALQKDAGCRGFATGSVAEGKELRKGLLHKGCMAPLPILSLLGLVTVDDIAACKEYGIIPLVYTFRQIKLIRDSGVALNVAIKCDTGMGRLGFTPAEIADLREALRQTPTVQPVLVVSHMHSADTDNGKEEVRRHANELASILSVLRQDHPDIAVSLGNSAGALLAPEIASILGPHVCRPGLALYGGNTFAGTTLAPLGRNLLPAMRVATPVLTTKTLSPGDSCGYGQTFVAERSLPIAIIAAGYADFLTRSLSNKGAVSINGFQAPIIGRVSMQMTAVDISACPAGERLETAWLLGGPNDTGMTAQELASLWGTISYEVLCLLGNNRREYVRFDA